MSSLPTGPLRVGIFGAGTVATAVATLLEQRGHTIHGVASPQRPSAEAAARRLSASVVTAAQLEGSDLILIGAPDTALADAVGALGAAARGAVVVHFAGSAGTEPLAAAHGAVAACALHPVQACPDVATAVRRLPGSAWGVTCSEHARDWARALVKDELGGNPVDVAEEDRVLWHAAAVTTSNGIAALMATGETILAAIGVASPEDVLGPIASGTVANAREVGGGAIALTGPVVRGEVEVIARHVDAVRSRAGELLPAYLDAVRTIVAGAQAAGRVDPRMAARIREILERS